MKLRKFSKKNRQMLGSLQKPFSGGTKGNQEKHQGQGSIWFFSDRLGVLQVGRKHQAGDRGFTTLQDIGD